MRQTNRLSARKVAALSQPGRYGDGGNLWLQISANGGKAWLFRYMLQGRQRHMGLGPVDLVPLAEAREKARTCRRMLLDGQDPLQVRHGERTASRLADATAVTFRAAAERYIVAHRPGWKNEKHASQWEATLATYVYPTFGDLPVAAVDVGLVLKVLEPIWTTKTETAGRVRGRIETVLDWATARGYRAGDNPARWRGHLDKLLPARAKVQKVEHHPALPYAELPAFVADLRRQDGVSPRALELVILTAVRTGEAIGATWQEIDIPAREWLIPPERMKAGRAHKVPLSDRVVAILEKLPREAGNPHVFIGGRPGKPLSNMAMLKTLERMGRGDLTTHGFRSTFRDWAAEQTNFAREAAEGALAHVVADKVEAAYRRGDMLAKRRRLMDAWSRYCGAEPAAGRKVVKIFGSGTPDETTKQEVVK